MSTIIVKPDYERSGMLYEERKRLLKELVYNLDSGFDVGLELFCSPESFMLRLCKELTTMKVYVPLDSLMGEGLERFELLSERKLVINLWSFLQEAVQIKSEKLLDCYWKNDADININKECLIVEWFTIFRDFRVFLSDLEPILDYLKDSYPQYLKEIPYDFSLIDYFEKQFITLVLGKFDKDAEDFVFRFWCAFWALPVSYMPLNAKTSNLIYLLNKLKVQIPKTENTVKDIVLAGVEILAVTKFSQNVGLDYNIDVITYCRKNAYLSSVISRKFIEESNEILLQNTIMSAENIKKIIEVAVPKLNENNPILRKKKIMYPLFACIHDIRLAFNSRSKNGDLENIMEKILTDIFKEKNQNLQDVPNFLEFLKYMYWLNVIIQQMKISSKLLMDTVTKVLASKARLYDLIIKLLEYHYKCCTDPVESISPIESITAMHTFPIILKSLPLDAIWLKMFASSIFRKAVIDDPHKVQNYLYSKPLEDLSIVIKSKYSSYQECNGLVEIINAIKNANIFAFKFIGYTADLTDKIISPLFLERSKIPSNLCLLNDEEPNLPFTVKNMLNTAENNFLASTGKPEAPISIKQAYNLHSCEVTSPFLIDGKYLTLQMNLYQTCVLISFNESNEHTLKSIVDHTNLSIKNVKIVLTSFIKSGLITQKDKRFVLNKTFQPDSNKIKNGKLRITLGPNKVIKKRAASPMESREGNKMWWQNELSKACIIRKLKAENASIDMHSLFEKVTQELGGLSIGEFKDTLDKMVQDKFIVKTDNNYSYF